jgi:hypothetical protein
MSATRLPLPYLVTCSEMSLESVELSRLNRAANLRKEFHQILEEWIDSEVDARLARSLLEWKRQQEPDDDSRIEHTLAPPEFQQLAIAFLPESSAPATHAAPECSPQSPRADVRAERVVHGKRAQSRPQVRKCDHAMAPSRSTQRAMSAEASLREVEHLAASLSVGLREQRRKCATSKTDSLPRPEPTARPRRACAYASRAIGERAARAIDVVPLCAEREEPEAPKPQSIRAEDSPARHILDAKLDKPQPKPARPGGLTPRPLRLPADRSGVHFHARQAV